MIKQWFLDLQNAICMLPSYQRILLLALFTLIACLSARDAVKAHYNAKKFVIKLAPIVICAISLAIACFIALV